VVGLEVDCEVPKIQVWEVGICTEDIMEPSLAKHVPELTCRVAANALGSFERTNSWQA